MGVWLDGIAFTTNFGQSVSMGCMGRPGKDSCPGDSGGQPNPLSWKYTYGLATQAQISKAVGYINSGKSTQYAIDNSIVPSTSAGFFCGLEIGWRGQPAAVCSRVQGQATQITSVRMFFMLPVISMAANSSMESRPVRPRAQPPPPRSHRKLAVSAPPPRVTPARSPSARAPRPPRRSPWPIRIQPRTARR